ncbi:MAG: hypothetical protein ABH865_00125, partial [Candidatus Omnitrophota bacterium]
PPKYVNVGIGWKADPLSSQNRLQVFGNIKATGGVQLGDDTTCDVNKAGTVRYNSGNIEYCDGTSWKRFGGPNMISCYKLGRNPSFRSDVGYYHTFTAGDCGGILPDASYTGLMQALEVCGGLVSLRVYNHGERGVGPGISWAQQAGHPLCTWGPGGDSYYMSAIYFKR